MDAKRDIALAVATAVGADPQTIYEDIVYPPDSGLGDYAYPCFKLAKAQKKSPVEIASRLAKELGPISEISSVSAAGPYLNFFADKGLFAQTAVRYAVEKGARCGSSDVGRGKTVVIDYSSPNIAKIFHVGHLRSTVIGGALRNIYKELGYSVVGVNHLGDWGTQFGKLMSAYTRWSSKELVERDGIKELTRVYIDFHTEAEKTPSLNDEARAWFVRLQNGDEEAVSLWKWFCALSTDEFGKIYDRLGVDFDYFTGESFYNDKMDAVVDELRAKGLLKESDGAQIVELDEYDLPPCLILRSDGGTLYPTRDIAAAIYRDKTFGFDKSLYVTALDQSAHFAQCFKVIELMGYDFAKRLIHVPFGLVSLADGPLSTRSGRVIMMKDILDEAVRRVDDILAKRGETPDREFIAEKVGVGAIIFNDVFNGRIKNVVFSWERALNFEGETGPYLQYTHARACSVLRKTGDVNLDSADLRRLDDEICFEVVKLVSRFRDSIAEAADKNEPHVISRHLIALAQAFNRFYHERPIIKAEPSDQAPRLALVTAVRNTLASGLRILGVYPIERM
jgi:arginyl-tRNA synthetase